MKFRSMRGAATMAMSSFRQSEATTGVTRISAGGCVGSILDNCATLFFNAYSGRDVDRRGRGRMRPTAHDELCPAQDCDYFLAQSRQGR